MGQLRVKQAAGPSSSQQQQQQQQQQDAQQGPEQQVAGLGVSQQQVERDLEQLAWDEFKAGQVLAGGRYKLDEKIPIQLGLAEGRFTTIWRGKDLTNGRDVVLKCLEAGDGSSYASGMREAALHAAAGRCPHIVGLLDAFEHRSSSGRHPVMVMEPCGTNLLNVVALYTSPQAGQANQQNSSNSSSSSIGGICDNPQALRRLARDTLTALNHLHKHGLVHMDLSPDNILLDKEFVPAVQLHAQALMPPGNILKGLQNKWRLFQAMLQAGSNPGKVAQLEQQLMDEMQAAVEKDGRYHEGNLHTATFKVTDFGRAVPYKDVLPGLPPGPDAAAAAAAGGGGGGGGGGAAEGQQQEGEEEEEGSGRQQQALQRHNRDGVVVFSDPTYQPPEEILGLSYISPSYDMWKLGCLLFEAATDTKLFDAGLRAPLEACYGEAGFSDQHYLLDAMTTTLGALPQELGRSSPLYEEFFCGQQQQQQADAGGGRKGRASHKAAAAAALDGRTKQQQQQKKKRGGQQQPEPSDMLLINAGPLKVTPGGKPLRLLLLERTVLNEQEADQMAEFLSQVLQWQPASRASAEQLLQHKWLAGLQPLQLTTGDKASG